MWEHIFVDKLSDRNTSPLHPGQNSHYKHILIKVKITLSYFTYILNIWDVLRFPLKHDDVSSVRTGSFKRHKVFRFHVTAWEQQQRANCAFIPVRNMLCGLWLLSHSEGKQK